MTIFENEAAKGVDLMAKLREHEVATVLLAGADTHGLMRGKRIPIEHLERVLGHGMPICDVFWVLHIDESALVPRPEGVGGYFPTEREGYPDIFAAPDPNTVRVMPWHDDTAIVLCDWKQHDGAPVPISPRGVLQRVVSRAQSMGFEPKCALELEFYVLRLAERRVCRGAEITALQDRPTTYGVGLSAESLAFADEVVRYARAYGLPVETCSPETGPGQFEITLRYGDALKAADDAFLFKQAVKEIAAQRNLGATFMAKPRSDWPGNSCHVHVSLTDSSDRNVLFDDEADDMISTTMRQFVAGMLGTMPEFTALLAPTINSYRRYGPYSWAGTTATWGIDNRSTGVRALCEGSEGTRVEHRQAGGDVNPYIAAAAVLAGGLHGIERGSEPPPPTFADVYALKDDEVPSLPRSLPEALQLLAESRVAREWLGNDFVDHFVAMKSAEHDAYSLAVTDWEVERYLEAL